MAALSKIRAHFACSGNEGILKYTKCIGEADGEPLLMSTDGHALLVTKGLSKTDIKLIGMNSKEFISKFDGRLFGIKKDMTIAFARNTGDEDLPNPAPLYKDISCDLKERFMLSIHAASLAYSILTHLGEEFMTPSMASKKQSRMAFTGKDYDLFVTNFDTSKLENTKFNFKGIFK